jgi:hypothetical protein
MHPGTGTPSLLTVLALALGFACILAGCLGEQGPRQLQGVEVREAQHRHHAARHVRELGRQAVDRHDLQPRRIELVDEALRPQRPAADKRPPVDLGVGVADPDDLAAASCGWR